MIPASFQHVIHVQEYCDGYNVGRIQHIQSARRNHRLRLCSVREAVYTAIAANLEFHSPGKGNKALRRAARIEAASEQHQRDYARYLDELDAKHQQAEDEHWREQMASVQGYPSALDEPGEARTRRHRLNIHD